MANVKALKIGSTSYAVVDATAAHSLSDIAVAGADVSFESAPFENFEIYGSPTINSNHELTSASPSKYLYFNNPLSSATDSFEIVIPAKKTSSSSSNFPPIIGAIKSSEYAVRMQFGLEKLNCYISTNGTSNAITLNSTTTISLNTKYYIKITYSSTTGYGLYLSTDGSTWTEEATNSTTTAPYAATQLGLGILNPGGSSTLGGTIYLDETYIKVDGATVWTPYESSGSVRKKIKISSSSLLKNQTSQTRALAIGASPVGTTVGTGSISIGTANATAENSIAIGTDSTGSAIKTVASGTRSIAIGFQSSATSMDAAALGTYASATYDYATAIGVSSNASASSSIALGYQAQATATSAIQLGRGTNSTANTFSVALSFSNNYRLLNSDGTIPGGRMALQGASAPDTSTVGSVGQFYIDTTNQDAYICVSDASSTYTWKKITP